MPSLWFVIPAYGRAQLAQICLRQLRRTCDSLTENGIEATAVVVADDENLVTARDLGFGTVRRENTFLSKRFNDGIQFACDRRWNPRPADYVVPCGSDDWIDWRILLDLPDRDTVLAFQRISFVREDGRELHTKLLNYPGGSGIRVYPRHVLAHTAFRPADEDRTRACDTSILNNLTASCRRLDVVYGDIDARQIVDWKSPDTQLNDWASLRRHKTEDRGDPFVELQGFYPVEALAEMEAHYTNRLVAA